MTSFCRPASGPASRATFLHMQVIFLIILTKASGSDCFVDAGPQFIYKAHTRTRSTHVSGAHNTHSNMCSQHTQHTSWPCPLAPHLQPLLIDSMEYQLRYPSSTHDTADSNYCHSVPATRPQHMRNDCASHLFHKPTCCAKN